MSDGVAKPVELEFKLDDRLYHAIENATLNFEKMVGTCFKFNWTMTTVLALKLIYVHRNLYI